MNIKASLIQTGQSANRKSWICSTCHRQVYFLGVEIGVKRKYKKNMEYTGYINEK